jgi:two-component system, cell cycle sensor histidine kinase and response regulator CckA
MQTGNREGLRVQLRLRQKADRDNPGQRRESEAPGKGERILVVDDHPDWLKVARTMLSAGGYDVQICQYPQDAVLLFKQNPGQIDLVITDLNMPSLNGIELAAELVRIDVSLPVVLTSVGMVRLTSEKLQALGVRNFLPKPWDRGQLFSIIRQALASKRSKETQ